VSDLKMLAPILFWGLGVDMFKITKLSPIPALFSIILLIIAVNGYIADKNAEQIWGSSQHSLPEGFYTFLRLSMFVTGSYSSIYFFSMSKNVWAWLMVFMALLFNPFVVVHLEHETWVNADAISAGILGFIIIPVKVKTTVASILLKYWRRLLIAVFIFASFLIVIYLWNKENMGERIVTEIRQDIDSFQKVKCYFPGDKVSIVIPKGWTKLRSPTPDEGIFYENHVSGTRISMLSMPFSQSITTKELSKEQVIPYFRNGYFIEKEGIITVDGHDLKFAIVINNEAKVEDQMEIYLFGFVYHSRLYSLGFNRLYNLGFNSKDAELEESTFFDIVKSIQFQKVEKSAAKFDIEPNPTRKFIGKDQGMMDVLYVPTHTVAAFPIGTSDKDIQAALEQYYSNKEK
jgi:hypothetical protein